MNYIISYKIAQSFNIGMDIDDENTRRYTEAVIEALDSGRALLDEIYEYPIPASSIIAEHIPDSEQFFTYLDFKIESETMPDDQNGRLRESLVAILEDGQFELVILWRRNLEAHIVFELKKLPNLIS